MVTTLPHSLVVGRLGCSWEPPFCISGVSVGAGRNGEILAQSSVSFRSWFCLDHSSGELERPIFYSTSITWAFMNSLKFVQTPGTHPQNQSHSLPVLSLPTLWYVSYTRASAWLSFPLPELVCLLNLREWSVYKLSCSGAFSSSSFSDWFYDHTLAYWFLELCYDCLLFSSSLWDYIFHLKKNLHHDLVWLYEGNLPSLIRSLHACMLRCFSRARLWDPMDCSPPGSSVHGILQARILQRWPFPSPIRSLVSFKSYIKSYFSNDSIRAQRG